MNPQFTDDGSDAEELEKLIWREQKLVETYIRKQQN